MASPSLLPLSVYYCYHPVDHVFCKALDVHLDPLKRNGWIHTWNDQQIPVGTEWKREREAHLKTAHLLVLFVSADFLASELPVMQAALQRHQAGEAIVIPILIRAANWEETDLRNLQVLPREQKAITTWPDQDVIWNEIAKEIQRVVEAMRRWVIVVYSPKDQAFVEQLRQDMLPFGVPLWDLERGQTTHDLSHDKTLRDAICAAPAVILIASPDIPTSRLVNAQLALAADYQRPILVVWARGEDWRTSNPENWRGQEVIDARGDRYQAAQKNLLIRLRQQITTFPSFTHRKLHREPRNPYKGLHAFTHDDAGDFFGREALIDRLAMTIETILTLEQKKSQYERLLPVIGPSGSGKSSVVMAGLLPCLQSGGVFNSQEWIYLDPVFPGAHPLEALAVSLAQRFPARSVLSLHEDFTSDSVRALHLLACQLVHDSQRKVVLIVDQFEEVFTLTTSEEERQHFLDLLVTAVTEPRSPVLVILTLRADFYDRPMQYAKLYQLVDAHHISVLPMESENLRRVIEQPAQLPDVQLAFEGDLVGDLLFEMRGQVGALPLLQFTLDQLFKYRDGHLLTLHAYHEIGGVKGALTKQAEDTYAGLPSDEHRWLAQTLFARLIDLGVTEQDTTRRRALLSEFTLHDAVQTHLLRETIDAFISARLLTTNEAAGITTIEVSHEALIREWTRLAEWIQTRRNDILLQRAISEDAAEWQRRGRPVDRLYRGTQLVEAETWAKRNKPSIDELAFLQDSATEVEHQKQVEHARQAKELNLQRRAARRQRYMFGMMGITAIALIAILVVTVILQAQILAKLPPTVTSLDDHGPGSLREAIASASDGGAITFANNLAGGTIRLTSGELQINKNLTISGPAASLLSISGENKSRVFSISAGTFVTISNLTIKNGLENKEAGGGIINFGFLTLSDDTLSDNRSVLSGGGIANQGTLGIENCTITHNQADSGAGISSGGTLIINRSTISNNTAKNVGSGMNYESGNGGGILWEQTISVGNKGDIFDSLQLYGQFILIASTISGNIASNNGGGIWSSGKFTLDKSTISGNIASGDGGGVWSTYGDSNLALNSIFFWTSTISGNTSNGLGGGIAIIPGRTNKTSFIIIISYCTIVINTSKGGGGVAIDAKLDVSQVYMGATIVADNRADSGPDVFGRLTSSYVNLVQNMSEAIFIGQAPVTNKSPNLGPLQNNGGLTQTYALLPGSPAIDQIPYADYHASWCRSSMETDQRGVTRPQGNGCDLGAYEYKPPK